MITLWLIRETDRARLYSRIPPERNLEESDCFWIPKSIIEHTTKRGSQHVVDIPDWFLERNNL